MSQLPTLIPPSDINTALADMNSPANVSQGPNGSQGRCNDRVAEMLPPAGSRVAAQSDVAPKSLFSRIATWVQGCFSSIFRHLLWRSASTPHAVNAAVIPTDENAPKVLSALSYDEKLNSVDGYIQHANKMLAWGIKHRDKALKAKRDGVDKPFTSSKRPQDAAAKKTAEYENAVYFGPYLAKWNYCRDLLLKHEVILKHCGETARSEIESCGPNALWMGHNAFEAKYKKAFEDCGKTLLGYCQTSEKAYDDFCVPGRTATLPKKVILAITHFKQCAQKLADSNYCAERQELAFRVFELDCQILHAEKQLSGASENDRAAIKTDISHCESERKALAAQLNALDATYKGYLKEKCSIDDAILNAFNANYKRSDKAMFSVYYDPLMPSCYFTHDEDSPTA
jgi:hypothetical protein